MAKPGRAVAPLLGHLLRRRPLAGGYPRPLRTARGAVPTRCVRGFAIASQISRHRKRVSAAFMSEAQGGLLVRCARREAIGLPEREMHLRRSRQVPRRAKRGALQSKGASGCARTPKGPRPLPAVGVSEVRGLSPLSAFAALWLSICKILAVMVMRAVRQREGESLSFEPPLAVP